MTQTERNPQERRPGSFIAPIGNDGWVSRFDRTPTIGMHVDVAGIKQNGTRYAIPGSFTGDGWNVLGGWVKLDRVSHWRPRPDLPKLTIEEELALRSAAERDSL